ncbi:MAG: hypothetical protein VXW87_04395 [Pseudomonadota bacterium]|nr:hypothetical protein [Pseudomonadota bacterium]
MADLSHKSTLAFWQDFMDGSIFPLIQFIEGSEDFANEHSETLKETLETTGAFLESATQLADGSEEHFVKLCAPLFMSQKLRIMQLADAISPGFATKMIKKSEALSLNDKDCEIFLKRNLLFERLRIISRVFSPEKIQLVQGIYES